MRVRMIPRSDQKTSGGTSERSEDAGYATVKLPEKKEKKSVMDWSETGKDFEDLIEK